MKLDGYVRDYPVGKGPSSLDASSISVEEQREAIEAYARKLGGRICAWHYDASVLVAGDGGQLTDGINSLSAPDWSGVAGRQAIGEGRVATGRLARPGLRAALERLNEGESDGIVVMTMDRLAPTAMEADAVFRGVLGAGRVLASCEEQLDPDTGADDYARILMRMPPPRPRDIALLWQDRQQSDREAMQRERAEPAPLGEGARRPLWRRILTACAVPLAALGLIRSPVNPPPPPAAQPVMVQKVEISISEEKGSSQPPPGSDEIAVASLIDALRTDKPGARVTRRRVIAGPELLNLLKRSDRR
jgi:Resolvase, N terminal domain